MYDNVVFFRSRLLIFYAHGNEGWVLRDFPPPPGGAFALVLFLAGLQYCFACWVY